MALWANTYYTAREVIKWIFCSRSAMIDAICIESDPAEASVEKVHSVIAQPLYCE